MLLAIHKDLVAQPGKASANILNARAVLPIERILLSEIDFIDQETRRLSARMHSIDYSEDDMEAAEEHSLYQYDGEESVEGTAQDMLDNLNDPQS
jgi:hypothetical protein